MEELDVPEGEDEKDFVEPAMSKWLSDLFDSTKSYNMLGLMKKISGGLSAHADKVPLEAQIKQDLYEAMKNLGESDVYDRQVDIQILIALYWLEFHFWQVAVAAKMDATAQRPFTKEQEDHMKADEWSADAIGMTTPSGREVASLINRLPEVERLQEETDDLFTMEYANNHRKGLQVIPWQQLAQYRCYLKGFYFHTRGNIKDALKFYTESLYVAEMYSVNYWRLCALENIEQIIAK